MATESLDIPPKGGYNCVADMPCGKGMERMECRWTAHLGCPCGFFKPLKWNKDLKRYE